MTQTTTPMNADATHPVSAAARGLTASQSPLADQTGGNTRMIDMLIAAALDASAITDTDRLWAASRPNRGAHARVISDASELPRAWAAFAQCVERRESKGLPHIVNPSSGAAGLYQFMPAWRTGLPYMVADRLREYGMPKAVAREVRVWLSERDISEWPEAYQRIGFAAVINAGGWSHWTGGKGCNALVPR